MKNTKNNITAIAMIIVLAIAPTFANAGIIISMNGERQQCTTNTRDSSFLDKVAGAILEGIIISKVGIIISKEGIIISRESSTCDSQRTREGIIIS